ncbi:helix-turn-helix domain-containing protein [Clostridium bovifaecis]|uniref:Helix-turn-helix domain-containing protein n=1 Tax=Clostridium bovifaecis TaxID=2184719 RepID=A0A6I6F910_9CLOT|nr:helix-turn-helix domain-containing protein [Clostridium bovifaecis]
MLIEYCNHELIDRILALGGDDYLVKPIRKENLLNSITEHIISLKTNKHLLKERELLILDKIILDKRDDAEELLKDIVESYSLISGGNLEAFKKYINEIGSKIIKISNKIGSKSNQVLNEEEYKHELKLLKDRESINRLIVNLLNSVFKDQLKNSVQWRLINDKHVSKNLEPALKYIEENYKEKISLEKAANVCNLSMYYFSKLFKRDTEMKFIDYISMYKVEKAKEMLKDTNVPVVNIAIDLGYDESGYFTKVFKKIVGLTPSEYRDINFK